MLKNLKMTIKQILQSKIIYYYILIILFVGISFFMGYNRGVVNTRLEAQQFGYGEYTTVEGTKRTEWKWYN